MWSVNAHIGNIVSLVNNSSLAMLGTTSIRQCMMFGARTAARDLQLGITDEKENLGISTNLKHGIFYWIAIFCFHN